MFQVFENQGFHRDESLGHYQIAPQARGILSLIAAPPQSIALAIDANSLIPVGSFHRKTNFCTMCQSFLRKALQLHVPTISPVSSATKKCDVLDF